MYLDIKQNYKLGMMGQAAKPAPSILFMG